MTTYYEQPIVTWSPAAPVAREAVAVECGGAERRLPEGVVWMPTPAADTQDSNSPENFAPCLTPADVRPSAVVDSPAHLGAIGGDSSDAAKRAVEIVNADVLEWAKTYDGPKFHAILCDPPYHLTSITERFGTGSPNDSSPAVFQRANRGFMGQEWDGGDIAFQPSTWAALKRHLHPGAFVMAFAGSRGWHRQACAIEDAGFIIHPTIFCWLYGSGFPKATRIDTQIDRDANAERQVVGVKKSAAKMEAGQGVTGLRQRGSPRGEYDGNRIDLPLTAAATDLARQWEGHRYGLQAMKPAAEPIIVAQVPYEGRPVDCITRTGAGALNIDGGRIGTEPTLRTQIKPNTSWEGGAFTGQFVNGSEGGRWPANFALSCACEGEHDPECPVAVLDAQSGETTSGRDRAERGTGGIWSASSGIPCGPQHGDCGGASRFFYCAKPTREERDAGLGGMALAIRNRVNPGGLENDPKWAPVEARNPHPTIKPLDLCRWLATLLLPPPEYGPRRLLVPFAGTGTEAIAAALVGWEQVIGIEQSAEYADLARARVAYWLDGSGIENAAPDAVKPHRAKGDQLDLFDAAPADPQQPARDTEERR